jgi:hypothetical protein
MLRRPPHSRRASTLVQAALVYPVVALLLLGVVILALGVANYQQVVAVAREGARWASVHGGQYAQETGNAMATQASVKTAILAHAAGLDTSQFNSTNPSVTWDNASEMPTYVDSGGNVQVNRVSVTVTYQWSPPLYLSPVTFTSTTITLVEY